MHSPDCRRLPLILLVILGIALGISNSVPAHAQSACNYYASPNGAGNGLTQASPFKISNFWAVAGPGKTLCLLNGVYMSAESMLTPPQNLSGTATARITIRALNDGGALIDGLHIRTPFHLEENDYWTIEGINVANSSGDVVSIYAGADNNIIRRLVAWNAADRNTSVFGIHHNNGNLLEDIAGFGTARKVVQASFGSNNLTIRRAWAMWNKSTWNTPAMEWPKETYSIIYENYNNICENCLATIDIDQDSRTDFIYGLLSTNWYPDSPNKCSNSRYVGSIAYTTSTQNTSFIAALYSSQGVDCVRFENVAVHLAGNESTANYYNFTAGTPQWSVATKITEIGTGDSYVGSDWNVSNRETASSTTSASNVWNGAGSNGARICYQYRNGVLTNIPLWPWPMNQRIADALRTAGRTPVDVTAIMEQKFGRIPSECRNDVLVSNSTPTTVSAPSAPRNVTISVVP
jgi:hypothetical protein